MAGLNVDNNILKIPINNVSEYNRLFTDKYINNLENLVNKGNYILGEDVSIFEEKLSNYIGVKHSIGLNSGTSALEIAFQILELSQDDEVIIQANAYIACAFGAIKSNAKLKIIDCEINGIFNINEFQKNINDKTKAVIVVHLYGDCCNMDELSCICREKQIILIEDCAQSFGSKYNNKMIGSFGDMSCHSFYPSKNLGALGDGGAICTNNSDYYKKIKLIRNLGTVIKYHHEIKGTNSRLDTLQASFLLSKFDDVDRCILHKQNMANLYKNMYFFHHIKNPDKNVSHSYHLFVIKLNDSIDRDHFMKFLSDHGIESIIHYKILFYKSKAFSEFNNLEFINAENLTKSIVSLPIYNTITEKEIKYIMSVLESYDINICPF